MQVKNKYGQYFTVSVIADFMVSLITKSKDASILEPSCGKGVFLDKLIENGYHNLYAYEIDRTLENRHTFVRYESFVSSPLNEKFDVVIGNPPYIRWKNLEPELKEELQRSSLWNSYFNSLCDYLFIFILKSIEQLNDGGELIFICTDYWMNTTHSLSLRNYMCRNGVFEEIYHFKEAPLFEKVNASFVIFKYRKTKRMGNEMITLFSYNKKGIPQKDDLYTYACFDKMQIPHFCENTRWLLASRDVQEELKDFENACVARRNLFASELNRIGDVCDIGNGMVSGLDSAFQVNETDKFTEEEKKALIDVLKAKDLHSYYFETSSKYIFVAENIDDSSFAIKYPNFYSILVGHKDKLQRRYNYGRDIPFWEFVFPRNRKLFERKEKKIFVPCKERISHKHYFRFCLAPENFYPLQDVTGIVKKSCCKESIEYLLAYLNDKRIFDWLSYNGIVKGAIVEFSEAPLASIPYRMINWNDRTEVKIHSHITEEVKQYMLDKEEAHIFNIEKAFNVLFYGKD